MKRGRKPGQLTKGSQFAKISHLQPGESLIIEMEPGSEYARNLPTKSRRPEFMREWVLSTEKAIIVYSPEKTKLCVKITRKE